MVPPKKAVKMDLNSFLNDETFNSSWAEEEVDLNKITIPIEKVNPNQVPLEEIAAKNRVGGGSSFGGSAFGGSAGGRPGAHLDPALDPGKGAQREEYPVPKSPPYRAIINNIPWNISPEGVKAWCEDGLMKQDAVEHVDLPVSVKDPTRLKGIAFVTFKEREDLVKALTFNATMLNDRTVYVSVAAPRSNYGFGGSDMDWGMAKGAAFADGEDPVDIDWGMARGSNFKASAGDVDVNWGAARGSNFKAPPPEVDIDWTAARGSGFKGEPKPEIEVDWSNVRRGSAMAPPPSEHARHDRDHGRHDRDHAPDSEDVNLDWSAARGAKYVPRRRDAARKPEAAKKDEPELDWGAVRTGDKPKPRRYKSSELKNSKPVKEEEPRIKKSAFDVLRTEGEDEEDEEDVKENKLSNNEKNSSDAVDKVVNQTAKLNIEDDANWETVGKK